jgi:XTP/dITP diphosphohydrolase
MDKLLTMMRRLRAPDGCPWDQAQTHESLRGHLLEEAAEAVDAIADGAPEQMVEELGDVLLQVAFHAVIAEEAGTFDYSDIEARIVDKLIRRHPHVFGDAQATSAAEVLTHWNAIKAQEQGGKARQVPTSLPALMRAYERAKTAALPVAAATLAQRVAQLDGTPERIAALLEAVAAYAAAQGVNPELALRDYLRRLEQA